MAGLTLLAAVVQGLAAGGVARLRGSFTAYAFQSPDAAEYVSLARGLAWRQRYAATSPEGVVTSGPDTWRTPGYPAFLALVVALFGDSPRAMLLAQQVLAALSVPMFWLVLRRFAPARWAVPATIGWCIDPFRVYYSLWLMAETLFCFLLLAVAWVWAMCVQDRWTARRGLALGLLAGGLVVVRPIGLPIPLLAIIGAGWCHRQSGAGSAVRGSALCAAGVLMAVAPWVVRNRLVAGAWAISSQSGASFAYHKVVDVVLWSQGRDTYRFDAATIAEVRDSIDRKLQSQWERRFGLLTPDQRENLTWRKLNYGRAEGVDPFLTSRLLWSVGWETLREAGGLRPMIGCFTEQGIKMLVFPLGLLLDPPVNEGAAPLSILGGRQGWIAARLAPMCIGLAYGSLVALAGWRVIVAVLKQSRLEAGFALWPAMALFVFSLPFEDPRFRLPMMPFIWLLAMSRPGETPREVGA